MNQGRFLTNGRYRVYLTAAGAGYSALGDILLTAWTADSTREAEGVFLYLRDLSSGAYWSAGRQPVPRDGAIYELNAFPTSARLVRSDGGVTITTDVAVAPGTDAEWRRYTVANRGPVPRTLELTICAEVALNTVAGHTAHPAFSKLFIQTEYLEALEALLARRRPRSPEEAELFLGARLLGGASAGALQWETDRGRFIGRGNTLASPLAMALSHVLSGTVGNVLDPVLVLRRTVTIAPGSSARLDLVFAAGTDRSAVEYTLEKAASAGAGDAIFAGTGTAKARPAAAGSAGTIPPLAPVKRRFTPAPGVDASAPTQEPLRFWNGYGGFSERGDEYVIRMDRTPGGVTLPPLAWTNVVANERAGFVASERGLGFTWSENSRENRLTPWFNDPLTDPPGEVLYIRDEESGTFWSPTPGPVPGAGPYEARHGFGYTSWKHRSAGLEQEVICFVPVDEPLKIVRLRLTNRTRAPKLLSVFYYAEWVLGGLRSRTAADIVTEPVAGGTTLVAGNPESPAFGHRVAFAAASGPADRGNYLTADRASFLGKYGSVEAPDALTSCPHLDGRHGSGLDPCAGFQLSAELAPGDTREWTFLLGQADDRGAALDLCRKYATTRAAAEALRTARAFWQELVSAIRIETPSPAMDLMVNGWLTYQNLSCRMWARSALYQSGGAYGYRDQLQDAAALVYHRPDLTRRQILLHAAHQFVEGDALHWWHPPLGWGIRTHFSDDFLWLPLVVEGYLTTTGDTALLDEPAPFLRAPQLKPGEDEVFLLPEAAGLTATVYEHCCRALDRSLARGARGLPLMGTGDWNDGMNRVGRLGAGESVWLGFFLHLILTRFLPICRRRGEAQRAARYAAYLTELDVALNTAGWDGDWYRRAYYDDGSPLGSASSDECRIDALAQAWAVLSRVAPPDRAARAIAAMEHYLVDERAGLIRLLTPPFDKTPHDPGYIKGYLPGVRENGGQYTHAALWAVRALAELGRESRAMEVFDLLNPVRHGGSPERIAVYRAEPYVVAADVYGVAPHLGRAGWTWYTGSAGWMFRVALESILGLTIRDGTHLALQPCLPPDWPGFTAHYRHAPSGSRYEIVVNRVRGSTDARMAPSTGSSASVYRVDHGTLLIKLPRKPGAYRIDIGLGPDVGPRYP